MRVKPTLFCLLALVAVASCEEWTPSTYPNPSTSSGAALCGRKVSKSAVCDPDGILSVESANTVEGTIMEIESAVDPYGSDGCSTHSTDLPGFQVAVALMDKMQLVDSPPNQAAATFAAQLFDSWGVGDAQCSNGVLLLLSRKDKQVYIRGGEQTMKVVPEAKLRSVVDGMVPALREGDYDKAVKGGVVDLGLVLAGADLQPESGGFDWGMFSFWAMFASILGFLGWGIGKQEVGKRRCRKLLDKLREEQAIASKHQRYPAKSCPICFEDFEDTAPSAPLLASQADPKGSDEDTRNPLLGKKRAEESRTKPSSKGRRHLSLPCGHSFCDPCISKWMENNSTCPICRKQLEGAERASTSIPPEVSYDPDMYAMEVQYRMGHLHRMYPYWVTSSMVDGAGEACRRGQAVDWNAVRQSQLANVEHCKAAGESGSSHNFGGGSSAGGGGIGGSW